ncbi:hypothetical protein [Chryseobacterium wanjuense]
MSADTDEQVFKKSSSKFMWKDSYCDFQGINGVNFKNYSVSATPTLLLLDNKGDLISEKQLRNLFYNKNQLLSEIQLIDNKNSLTVQK